MTDVISVRNARRRIPPPAQRANWFSDLRFVWFGLIVKKTGRFIGPRDLTPVELGKFFGYFGPVLWQGLQARMSARRSIKVWFAPDRPRPWYVIWSALTLAGIRIARSEAESDASFYFEDVTIGAPPRRDALNAGCTDISKSYVAHAFERVAGYPLALDPETHDGVAVEKDEQNGAHDGRLVHCPTTRRPGKTYQRFIDSADGETAFDYRTTIIGQRPLCVLVKSKPASARFSIHNTKVVFAELASVFTPAEIDLLTRFAEEMQLDWSALDVLRDRVSDRIYVVDVNKTDTGPAVDLSHADREKLKAVLARGFHDLVAPHG
ncbi:hypothetical protein U91I_02203 [alpha proteobacterium U9-1i]|nr:hypothetical protein U91I_02203 [alpha proteobacterium U9-1i]